MKEAIKKVKHSHPVTLAQELCTQTLTVVKALASVPHAPKVKISKTFTEQRKVLKKISFETLNEKFLHF